MTSPSSSHTVPPTAPPISGVARVDANARKLATRLESGDIAIIDFKDLDRATAQAFVAAGASAVLNAAPSMTGRYPNLGPLVLLEHGIAVVDDLGPDVMTVKEGSAITVDDYTITHKGKVVATGNRISLAQAREITDTAREGFANQVQAFAATTGEYLEREAPLVMSGSGMPNLAIDLHDKIVLLVLDDADAPAQLKAGRAWINDTHPIVITVDGGAQIAQHAHLRPSIIVGDMELVPEKLLRSEAELVIGTGERYARGADRVKRMGLSYHSVTTTATAPDVAILMAALAGAKAVVTVGDHTTFEDFLDRGRTGMAASFFTRLRAGGQLIALPAVVATYKPRIRAGVFILLIAAAATALGAAFLTTPLGDDLLNVGIDTFTISDAPASAGSTE